MCICVCLFVYVCVCVCVCMCVGVRLFGLNGIYICCGVLHQCRCWGHISFVIFLISIDSAEKVTIEANFAIFRII